MKKLSTLQSRLAALEALAAAHRADDPADLQQAMDTIMNIVNAGGGREPGEAPAGALCRLTGITGSQLERWLADGRDSPFPSPVQRD
ncbi:MAG: hypothetical protein Tsb0016_07430 [Sphingomonadales bacterium]